MSISGERENAFRAALEAEPDWQALLRHFDFNDGFAFILILVESAENAAYCREAVSDYLRDNGGGRIRRLLCNYPNDAQELPFLLHRPSGLDSQQTLWVESVVPETSVTPETLEKWKSAWRVCFASLNQIRNQMQHSIPGALVFAVAPWVQQIIRNIAPDLWSIRSTVVQLSPRIANSQAESASTPSFRGPESDPSLAPDPEFAEQEASRMQGKAGKELAQAQILQRAGEGYLSRAEPVQAIRVLKEAEALQIQVSAPAADISQTKTLLGRAYRTNAQWPQAEQYFREALEMDRSRMGEDHPTIATDLEDLARLLLDINRLEEAEPLFRDALAIEEKTYGPDHTRVAVSLNSLATLLQKTNRSSEAELLYRRALEINERSFGPDHPQVAIDLNNLAFLLKDDNRLAEAEPMYQRALTIDEKRYGPNHPDVAIDLSNLAALLKETNRIAEAEPMYRRALAIDEKSYGPEHPSVASRLNNLALLLQSTNRQEEAEFLLRRALSILEAFTAKTGQEHPYLAVVRSNYQQLLDELGRDGSYKLQSPS